MAQVSQTLGACHSLSEEFIKFYSMKINPNYLIAFTLTAVSVAVMLPTDVRHAVKGYLQPTPVVRSAPAIVIPYTVSYEDGYRQAVVDNYYHVCLYEMRESLTPGAKATLWKRAGTYSCPPEDEINKPLVSSACHK